MKIKQVEELVGITQKNIRFYEDQGLLKVERAENGYREYSLEDVKRLKEIKMLRLIAVPIEDIKLLISNKKSLDEILESQVLYLDEQKNNMENMKNFCKMLADKDLTFDSLDVDECLSDIEQLKKEGTQFMDIEKTDVHMKKKLGALMSAAIMIIVFLLLIIIMAWAYVEEPIPLPLIGLCVGLPVVCIVCLVVAFIQRNREIEGGEEDEASKY